LIRNLCDNGYASAVLISIDAHWFLKKGKAVVAWSEEYPQVANRPYSYMITDAVPALLKAGFSKKEIDTFLIDNPRSYFSERWHA